MDAFVMAVNGPMFLAVFVAYAVTVTGVLRWWTRRGYGELDPGAAGGAGSSAAGVHLHDVNRKDPYEIAYLTDGARGVIRAGMAALMDRKVLVLSGDKIGRGDGERKNLHPVEAMLVSRTVNEEAKTLLSNKELKEAVESLLDDTRERLVRLGLVYPESGVMPVLLHVVAGLVLVDGLAFWRLGFAMEHHHHNVGFLILLTVAATICLPIFLAIPAGATRRGKKVVEDLQSSLESWKDRLSAQSGATSQDWALAAGLFGLAALAGTEHDAMAAAMRAPNVGSGSGCSSGSSCSSGCSSGGGCGGGGCGGGGCGGGGGD